MNDKIAILEKQIDRQEQYSRRNSILLHGIPECKGEVTHDVVAKIIWKNINDTIITVDDVSRSHRIEKYHPQRKNLKSVIVKFARYNVRDRSFSNKRTLKRKQISISESLTKLCSMKLKEARDRYTFANVWTQDSKIMFKDDNKVKVYFD